MNYVDPEGMIDRKMLIKGGEAIATGACSLISATLLTISSMKIGPFRGRNGKNTNSSMKIGPFHGRNEKNTISSMKPGPFRGRDGI